MARVEAWLNAQYEDDPELNDEQCESLINQMMEHPSSVVQVARPSQGRSDTGSILPAGAQGRCDACVAKLGGWGGGSDCEHRLIVVLLRRLRIVRVGNGLVPQQGINALVFSLRGWCVMLCSFVPGFAPTTGLPEHGRRNPPCD